MRSSGAPGAALLLEGEPGVGKSTLWDAGVEAAAAAGALVQTQNVRFFTENPFVQYGRALRDLANARGLDLSESARLLAYVNVANADTMIACWWAKYHYAFWRPNHAIERATPTATRPRPPSRAGCRSSWVTTPSTRRATGA